MLGISIYDSIFLIQNEQTKNKMTMKLKKLSNYLNNLLNINNFSKDGSNNGLQVEATDEVKKVGFAVDACMKSFQRAAEENCDLLIVHHGISWGPSLKYLTGLNAKRVGFLFRNNLSLYAAHLPLDAHNELGHNAQIAKRLEITDPKPFAEYAGNDIGFYGQLKEAVSLEQFVETVNSALSTDSIVINPNDSKRTIKSVGIVSGGAADEVVAAAELGLDAYITGEFIHQHYHTINELDIPLIAAGHYKSEVPGIEAVMENLEQEFGIETLFIDIPTGL